MIKTWRKLFAKYENIRAYTLLFPALLLVILAMASPLILMLVTSFHTQVSMMEIDSTLTLDRYADFFSRPVYPTLLFRSIKISFLVTPGLPIFMVIAKCLSFLYFLVPFISPFSHSWLPFQLAYFLRSIWQSMHRVIRDQSPNQCLKYLLEFRQLYMGCLL